MKTHRNRECILYGCFGIREDQPDGSILWRCVYCDEIVNRMSMEKREEVEQNNWRIWSIKVGSSL